MDNLNSWLGFFDVLGPWGRYVAGFLLFLLVVLAVFGALDVPLVYFSIWFFRTQHPQPVIGGGGSIDPRMMQVLMINWLAFLCFAYLVSWSRYRLEVIKREVEQAQGMQELRETRAR